MTTYNFEAIMRPLGDSAIVVQLSTNIHPTVHQKIIQLTEIIEKDPFTGFIEVVPSYNSVTIYYNPIKIYQTYTKKFITVYEKVSGFIENYLKQLGDTPNVEKRLIEVPVVYGGTYGPDLEEVARSNNLSTDEVIAIHSKPEYLVYMIGFAPGFPYLGGMNESIATPRKETPRPSIPSRSIGIAGKQTGIYTLETPGGWQIIGRTPLNLFSPKKNPPSLLKSGDKIRFVPITSSEYEEIRREQHDD